MMDSKLKITNIEADLQFCFSALHLHDLITDKEFETIVERFNVKYNLSTSHKER